MNKSGKIICGIVIAILIAVIAVVSTLVICGIAKNSQSPDAIVEQGNGKILALHWGEGFGDGSTNYEIEIYGNGKVIINYGNEWRGREKKKWKIDKEKIEELKEVINDNAKNVTMKETDRFDYGGTSIKIYKNGKETYSFSDSFDKAANENFFNIVKKVKEIKSICEGK